MEWLNYHHLLYFYVVAREGSIAKACTELRLAQPTISGQLRVLEESFGEKLFERRGRGLALTEVGKVVYGYAEQIFDLGKELQETLKNHEPPRRPLIIGLADVLPKIIAHKLIEPARRLPEPVHIICREGRPEMLVAQLALHNLDIVLSDAPIDPSIKVKAYSHLLGECGIMFFGSPKNTLRYKKNFPKSLDGAPTLLPSDETTFRAELESWFESIHVRPMIVGEFADSALLHIFGEAGDGVFPAPDILEPYLKKQHGVQALGKAEGVQVRFYVISVERKLKHPAAVAICEAARHRLFG
jgi:LysR family transcriptional activator of nhaA